MSHQKYIYCVSSPTWHPEAGGSTRVPGLGIAKHDAILTISGLNCPLEFNIDEKIVPVLITLRMSHLKDILLSECFWGS